MSQIIPMVMVMLPLVMVLGSHLGLFVLAALDEVLKELAFGSPSRASLGSCLDLRWAVGVRARNSSRLSLRRGLRG